MNSKEVFEMAGKIRGALWLYLVLSQNTSDAVNENGWLICGEGRPFCRQCLAELLGTTVESVDVWILRLMHLELLKCQKVDVMSTRDDHSGPAYVLHVQKTFALAAGSIDPVQPPVVH